jgi:hypothetical protein
MSTGKASSQIRWMDPRLYGTWLVERQGLWQMKLLDPSELAIHACDRGVNFTADDIVRLWSLRLLKADLVLSDRPLRRRGLLLSGRDYNGLIAYADARTVRPRKRGWLESAARISADLGGLELRFHPFRYWILFCLKRSLSFDVMPIQALISMRGYERIARTFTRMLKRWEFASAFERWNDAVALMVASEPCVLSEILGQITFPPGRSADDQRRLMAEHAADVRPLYQAIPGKEIVRVHQQSCVDAYRLDSNRAVYALLRLGKGRARLELKDAFGGAVYLRTIAEVLRRMTEQAHNVRLDEEDYAGIGQTFLDVRERIYGARRLFDDNRAVRRGFMRQFQLDFGSRLRWYVEGDTEEGALRRFFGEAEGHPVTIVNLRGNVVRGNALAFREALRDDLKSGVFSVVSLDGDRTDFVRAARKAAEDDEICGQLYINDPDFEFANFSVTELEEIAWRLAEAAGEAESRIALRTAVATAKSGREFMEAATRAVPTLARLAKGREWGRRLTEYAFEHPKRETGAVRSIVEAVTAAARDVNANYNISRKELRIDPGTGRMVKRITS